MKSSPKNQGFTILETIVAIAILLVAIAGPLTVAEKGLIEAVSSQDQLTASYLAQDLMEYVKNVRDDNLLNNRGWLTNLAISQTGGSICAVGGSPCDFDTETGNALQPTLASCTNVVINSQNLCQIYLNQVNNGSSNTYYYTPYYDSGVSTKTKFSRTFSLTPTGGLGATATSSLVTVTVDWKTGDIADQVVIQDMLFDTTR